MKSLLETAIGKIISIVPVSGGDIAQASRVVTQDREYFVKSLTGKEGRQNLVVEKRGLEWLGEVEGVRAPQNLFLIEDETNTHLVMPFYTAGQPKFEDLGVMLAQLHQHEEANFGWSYDNYIGRLKQSNTMADSWPQFWANRRLVPQLNLCREQGYLTRGLQDQLDLLIENIGSFIPDVKPSRLHGDLWNGNVIYDENGAPLFIDPSVYVGHREVDIAMMHLFGGFNRQVMDTYQHIFPLEKGWQRRMPVYQLYYALVHVNLFGQGYESLVERLLNDIE